MKLTNVEEVKEAIMKLASEPQTSKPSKLMLAAVEAAVSQIEAKNKGNQAMLEAMATVRKAYGISNDSLNGGSS